MMILFYQAVLENVIRYRMHLWYGNLTVQLKSRLGRFIQTVMIIMTSLSPDSL